MNKADLDLILSRLKPLFTRKPRTRYWLLVAYDPYDAAFNFFFNQQQKGHRLKSTPLHSVRGDLAQFEAFIAALQKQVHFSIEYTGLAGKRWPSSWRYIEPKKFGEE